MIFIAVEGAQASFLVKDHSDTARRHFEALDSLFVRTMGTPGGRAWLSLFSGTLHPDFVSHMDNVLASSPISRIVTKEDWIEALNALALENAKADERAA